LLLLLFCDQFPLILINAKAEKCKFHSDSVEYLGYVLSPSGLTMSNAKVKTIQDWLELEKVKDI